MEITESNNGSPAEHKRQFQKHLKNPTDAKLLNGSVYEKNVQFRYYLLCGHELKWNTKQNF